ncbi:hypothetical protein VCHA35O141_90121 [Vibrio chagasii]|uniref:hypothetical protein n=1 Tax=Vibrio chagasii TaxID=170679 RepID=UPI003372E546|nr:hypothetical protein VCHA34P129_120072 [Vibrio chagasii]CAH6822290.1 hypothetical protein VCHA36P164_150035 [Vibrio chagasii]CAH6917803.1 hypothetical protein VCHA40P242_130072 [Vibrio chagasii]CAH6929099.1 hypothetical protein VCHA55P509_120010 [Vibrio chagasii]CAH6965429.1 hypothetical protein VCHA54O485_130121 [Vibrio chagasii]
MFSGLVGFPTDPAEMYQNFQMVIEQVADMYDDNSKLYCNKKNFARYITQATTDGLNIWFIQNVLVLGRYPVVIVDQLSDDIMYFGDIEAAFDVVGLQGTETVDEVTVPDTTRITNTGHFATVAKDNRAIVAYVGRVA